MPQAENKETNNNKKRKAAFKSNYTPVSCQITHHIFEQRQAKLNSSRLCKTNPVGAANKLLATAPYQNASPQASVKAPKA